MTNLCAAKKLFEVEKRLDIVQQLLKSNKFEITLDDNSGSYQQYLFDKILDGTGEEAELLDKKKYYMYLLMR